MAVSPLNKQIKEMSIDRLSALPDSLVIHILSFLIMKEAAVTAVLSKRWQFLWTELPRLRFRESSRDSAKVRKFAARVNRTLMNCSRKNLEKFKIMYFDSSLIELSVQGCEMSPRRTIEWPSLTKFKLEDVVLDQDVIEKILSGCPVLHCLILRNCLGVDCLKVNSPGLNKLEVRDIGDADDPLLEISAPFVHTLDVRLSRKGRRLQATNFPSIVRARFDVNDNDWNATCEELIMSAVKPLFENILHVNELEIAFEGTEFLSTLVVNGWKVPQSRRRCLKVCAYYEEKSISGIVSLLESSPNLEKLVIEGFDYHGDPVTLGPSTKGDLDCNLLHLKTVRIIDFTGEPMLKLAEILLKRAVVLEKMVIDVRKITSTLTTSNLSEIAQTLVSYPRSSQKFMSISTYERATQSIHMLL